MPALANLIISPPLTSTYRQIGRTKLATPSNSIIVANLPKLKWLQILCDLRPSGVIDERIRFNNDSGLNYVSRRQVNGAADVLAPSLASIQLRAGGANSPHSDIIDVLNIATIEKAVYVSEQDNGSVGAANAPNVSYTVAKWSNVVDFITEVDIINVGAGTFDIGSEVIVLGKN